MQTQSKQIDFNGQNFYCGIDTHKKNWTVTIQTDELVLKTFLQDPEPDILIKHLHKNYPGGTYLVGYEAGYFGYSIQREFESKGVSCMVIHPADIPTTQKDKERKSDPRDSRKIAKSMRNKEAKPIWVPPISIEEDRQLLRAREKLSMDYTRIKNRIKASLQINGIKYPEIFSKKGSHWSARFIKWLSEIQLNESSATEAMRSRVRYLTFIRGELLNMTKQIRLLANHDRYNKVYPKLIQIPGIGVITAMTILTETGDIHRFKSPDNYRSFLGLVPRVHGSGDKVHVGKITKRANTHLRYLITEGTWTAIRSDSFYLNLYKDYRKRMKPNIALIRTARKLANQIYYCLRNETILQ